MPRDGDHRAAAWWREWRRRRGLHAAAHAGPAAHACCARRDCLSSTNHNALPRPPTETGGAASHRAQDLLYGREYGDKDGIRETHGRPNRETAYEQRGGEGKPHQTSHLAYGRAGTALSSGEAHPSTHRWRGSNPRAQGGTGAWRSWARRGAGTAHSPTVILVAGGCTAAVARITAVADTGGSAGDGGELGGKENLSVAVSFMSEGGGKPPFTRVSAAARLAGGGTLARCWALAVWCSTGSVVPIEPSRLNKASHQPHSHLPSTSASVELAPVPPAAKPVRFIARAAALAPPVASAVPAVGSVQPTPRPPVVFGLAMPARPLAR
eukprot:scaffold93127_cov25-Tisochrysis_lutea.AAC.1